MTTKNSSAMILTVVSDCEIMLTREFDAPRSLVFEAISKPEHIVQWWGPRQYTTVFCEMDFRPGGTWRFVQRGPDGNEFAFRGVYREIVPPERVVQTFIFEPVPDQESVETMTLTEHGGKTTVKVTALYESVEARDAMLQSGMEAGAAETYDRLAEYLKTMA